MWTTRIWSEICRGSSAARAVGSSQIPAAATDASAKLRPATGLPPRGASGRVIDHPDDRRPWGSRRLQDEDVALPGVHPAHDAVRGSRARAEPRDDRDAGERRGAPCGDRPGHETTPSELAA